MKDIVSIIIPWFNTDVDLVRQAIKSCLIQTFSQVEIVICNDGSTKEKRSNLLAMVSGLGEKVVYVENEKTKGISVSRNKAVSASQGDWLIWLDADDTIDENCVSNLLAKAQSTKKEMIVGECIVNEGNYLFRRQPSIYFELAKSFHKTIFDPFMLNVISLQPQIIRRDVFLKMGGFSNDFLLAEMTEFFLRFIVNQGFENIGYTDDSIYFYNRNNKTSVSTQREQLFRYRKKALLNFKDQMHINVDDIVYLGRANNTGMQCYAPKIGKETIIPSYLNLNHQRILIRG